MGNQILCVNENNLKISQHSKSRSEHAQKDSLANYSIRQSYQAYQMPVQLQSSLREQDLDYSIEYPRTWMSGYVILKQDGITIFEDHSKVLNQPLLQVEAHNIHMLMQCDTKIRHSYAIQIEHENSAVLYLGAPDEKSFNRWFNDLENIISMRSLAQKNQELTEEVDK